MSSFDDDDDLATTPEDFLNLAAYFRFIQDYEPERFKEVAELEKISVRKAYYLASIDRTFSQLNVPADRLRGIGWSKLRMLTDLIDAGNCEELLSMAETATVQQLALLLRGREPTPDMRCVTLYFEPDEYEIFERAVLEHGGARSGRGLADKERALTAALAKLVLG